MPKSYSSIKAGWVNPNIDTTTGERKKKKYNEIKSSDYDFGVDNEYINSFYNDYQKYAKNTEKEYKNVGFKNITELYNNDEKARSELRDRASNIRAYINSRKNNISEEDYNSISSALENFNKYTSSVGAYYKNKKDLFSQFKSEDEYNAAKNTQQYKDYSYDDIQRTIAIKQRRGDDKSEIEWLKNYALTKDYATSDDYDKGLNKAIDSINLLSKEKSEIQQRMSGYERGRLQYTDQYKSDKERLSEIDKEIEQAKKTRDSLQSGKILKQKDEELQNEMSVQNNADFADVSANRDFNNPTREELKNYDMRRDTGTWYTDEHGNYYNSLGEKIGKNTAEYLEKNSDSGINDKLGLYLSAYGSEYDLAEAAARGGYGDTWADTVLEGINGRWEELNDNEKSIYYYYLNKGEKDNAYKFLSNRAYQLGMRADEKQKAKMEGANALEMIAMNAASVPANVFGGIAAFASDTINTIKGKDINPYDMAHSAVNFAQNTREETSQRIDNSIDDDFISTLVSNSYQAVMSGADSLLGAATLGSGYTVTMGMGAASQKAQELYENGASRGQIALGALASGVTEWLTEKLSYDFIVDKLWKNPKSGKDLIKALLASAGNEGIEEVNSDVLNLISDSVIQGYNSVSERTVREIMNTSGVSEEEARRQVAAQNAIDIFWSGYGGFISGGLLAGGGLALNLGQSELQNAAYNRAYNQQSGENIVNNSNVDSLVEVARSLDDSKANAKVKALAEEIANTDTSGLSESEQEAFSNRVGKLYSEVQKAQERAYQASDKTAIKPVIKEKIKDKGITDENVINKATDAIYKTVYDSGSLSSSEENLIKHYKLESVANELINDNGDIAAKGEKATKQARNMYLETAELADNKPSRQIDTSSYELSDDGKTYRKDSGEEVKITGISTIKNGKMTVNLSDGSSTSLDNISLGSNDEAILYEGVLEMGVSAASAQMIIKSYNPSLGMNALNYIRGVQDAVKYGKIGGKAFLNDGVFTSALPEKLRNDMYHIGEIEEDINARNKNKAIEKLIKNNKGSKKVVGTVTFKGVNRDNLNEMQKVSVNAVETVFGEMGINVVFFQSPTNKNGEHIGKNGSYDPSTNTVTLDIFAGAKGQDTILFTAAHELTHFIKEWSPLKFRKFANFLIENYAKHGQPIDELIKKKIASSKKSSTYSKPLTYDQAFEEVVADSCETFLRDSRLTEKLTELAKADMTLFERIKLYINDLLEKLKKAYAGLTPDSREGKIVLDMKDCIEELHNMWEEAALDARNNFQSAGGKSLKGNKNTVKRSDRITENMTDSERYELLKNRQITLVNANVVDYKNAVNNYPELLNKKLKKSEATKLLRKVGEEFGVFRDYENKDIEVNFEFGKNNLNESITKQNGNFDIYTQMLSCFSGVISNAIGIEVHNRNNEGYKTDATLQKVYVLCSAFENDTDIIPVKLSIKEFSDKPNRLYVAVALESIKKDRVVSMGVPNTRSHVRTSPVIISIRDLFSKINPKDGNFLKYIPNQFLNNEQINAKNKALEREKNGYINNNSTEKFSMRENVEETKDLIAVHNMQVSELEKSLQLGGLPMPSIAIIKAQSGHSEYGDVSLVFNKDTIDPQLSKDNKVYGGDAWTPTYPTIEYKANEKVAKRIRDLYYDIAKRQGYDEAKPLYNYAQDLSDELNRNKGEAGLIEYAKDDTKLMQLYLLESGKGKVEDVVKETRTELSQGETEQYDYLINSLGEDVINSIKAPEGSNPLKHRVEFWEQNGEKITEAYKKLLSEEYGFTDEQVANVIEQQKKGDYIKMIMSAYKYLHNGATTVKTEKDFKATQESIQEAVKDTDYNQWVENLFKGSEEKSGIRNNVDYFTPMGNRRSFEATHWENNLENVVRAMKSEVETGGGALISGLGIYGVSAKKYNSIDEIKADSDRLTHISEDEYKEIKRSFGERLGEIANSIMDKTESNPFIANDNACECIVDAIRNSKTKSGILKNLKQYRQLNVTETTVDDIVSLVSDIANMPTEYFEAKPQRAVGFEEVAAAIIPDNASAELKNKLSDIGVNVIEYESGNEESRLNALNGLDDVKFSDRDNLGNALTEAQQSYFAESKVRDENGNLKVMYRGDNSEFTVFDRKKSKSSNLYGRGFYFTDSKTHARQYGLSREFYLNIENPLQPDQNNITKPQMLKFLKSIEDNGEEYDLYNYGENATPDNVLNSVWGKGDFEMLQDINATAIGDLVAAVELFNEVNGTNYDGIILPTETITFNSNQAKLTSNKNPTDNEDMRFSDRDPDAVKAYSEINKQLTKENQELREDVEKLKELSKLQKQLTHGKMFTKSSIDAEANVLMNYVSAKGDKSELISCLNDLYSYIANGEELSWEGIKEKAAPVVNWLQEHEYHKPQRDEYANEALKHLRTLRVSLNDEQKQEVTSVYGSYNEFRKKNMGRIIFTDDGTPLDTQWQELAKMYPAFFDRSVTAENQPIELMDIIYNLQSSNINGDYYFADEMAAQDLLVKVYEGYWNLSTLHTFADVKQKEINLLKAKHNDRISALRKAHNEKDAKLKQEYTEKTARLRKWYRDREAAKLKDISERYQKSRKDAVDRVKEIREKRDAVTKLQRLVLDTAKWVSYPKKDDVKCPDFLRSSYAEFLRSIDLSSKRLLKGGESTQNDLRVSSAMDSLATAIASKLGTQDPNTETVTVLDTGYLDLPEHFVENLRELSESLKKRMVTDGHIVNSMTSEEVKELTKFIRTLNHSIKEMSTLYSNMRFARVEQLGNDTMVFLKDLGEAKQSNSITNFVTWDNALPYYVFKRFGVAGESVFEELMDAQDKLAYLADKIFKFKEKTWDNKESSEWSKDTHTIKLPSGRELTLTSADAMSIYCLSRREQGRQHLLGGGVRVLGIERNGKKANDSRSLLSLKDIDTICSSLTERQKKVAEAIQEYMSTVCADWGNEISMKRFLTKEFTEKFYFPIESNDENLDTKDPKVQQSDLYRLLNISATKPLTKGANNEVIIRNVFDVFTNHSSDMAKLNAYGMALLDYMKWINYREKNINDDGQISVNGVRKSMEKAYGPEAKKYVIGLIKDINGRANDSVDHPVLMKMTRMAKTAMVGANLRVSLLQFTAYPRAALVLSNKSLSLGLTKKPQIKKAKKYCGIALWKSFGFYDTNISRSIEDQLKGTTNIRQKLIELSLKGAEWGDAITWGYLWNACEYEVAKTKQYKVGSEEFNQAVGKKLRDVVYATQVVDSTLTRSQMMRNKSGLTQSATAFMSEPTLSANILMDAGFQFNLEKRRTGSAKLAWQKTGKYIGKTVAVYSIGQIIVALAEALADAYRDDDDEKFMAKFGEAFKENAISDLNPFNKIPLIADVSDFIFSRFGIGFSSSNSLYLQALDEASKAFDIWKNVINGKGGETVYAGIYSTTKLLSYITGASASGAMREIITFWNNTAGVANPYLKIRTYESSATDKSIAEYYFDKGDTAAVKATASKMVEDKIKSGKTQKEAKSEVKRSLTSTYKPKYIKAYKKGDEKEKSRIRSFLYYTGIYGSLSEVDSTLKEWMKDSEDE